MTVTLSGLDVQPKPFQAEMLEQLDAERTLHDRHRNLVVSATGTGKTVVAALDYRRLVREQHGRDLTLLFVAHRVEILRQARRTYQEVLSDHTFGELLSTGETPREWRQVFASVQSLSADRLARFSPGHFEVVVIDEFHHAEAASYRRILERVTPIELVGLTATPERGDGVDVRTFFAGRVASELRLWDALNQNLLVPFHYFGVHDGTDLRHLRWRSGAYDSAALNDVFTGDDARTRVILREVRDKVPDVGRMRALGFCVGVEHARYMAQRFVDAGIPARAVSAGTTAAERADVLRQLRHREINAVFAVDLFNEGLDIPEVDTVLFLRPTESATVFLQQLGRGLRMQPGKWVLTALDFIGHQRREFRFDQRLLALTGVSRRELPQQIDRGFPFLPSGSQIVLDPVAREIVLNNVREQVSPRWPALVSEVRGHPGQDLAAFLSLSGRDLRDVVRPQGRTWTVLCREAGKAIPEPGPLENQVLRRARAFFHVDDMSRAAGYTSLLRHHGRNRSPVEEQLASMLFFSVFPNGGGFKSIDEGIAALQREHAASGEFAQIVNLAFDHARRSTYDLSDLEPRLSEVPLAVHASYNREEILAALGHASLQRTPNHMREGVTWCPAVESDALLVTLKKAEADYSPTTMYRDFALNPELFHWESQSTTSSRAPTGRRYIEHADRGSHVLLFIRAAKQDAHGAAPYVFLGPVDYVSHSGDRPVAITWKLRKMMPTEVFLAARAAVA